MLPVQFVVYELLRGFHFNPEVINQLYHSFENEGQSTGKHFYSRDYAAYIDRRRIIVMPIPADDTCELEADAQTRRLSCGGNIIRFERLEVDDLDTLQQPDNVALIDESKLRYPLRVRRWRMATVSCRSGCRGTKGERFPGRQQGVVTRQTAAVRRRIRRRDRLDRRPQGDERFRVGSATENVLRLTAEIDPA